MTYKEQEKTLKANLVKHGDVHQVIKFIEEMGEATQALSKWLNLQLGQSPDNPVEVKQKVEEELGHVAVFLVQMGNIFDQANMGEHFEERIERIKSKL